LGLGLFRGKMVSICRILFRFNNFFSLDEQPSLSAGLS
jgi:hypothetical protein